MAKKQTHTTKGLRPPKRHTAKQHAKVYWPYLPLLVLLVGGLFLNIYQPLQSSKPATLAYATEMSRSSLLVSTNNRRTANGAATLSLNSQLNAAAQVKAEDMITRDYWSHNTPDGQEPWVFIDAQGYDYTKAGENLAYGFASSDNTVTGWMNSPSHRDNMLDTVFTEVGFGFANSSNFVGTGEQTIVVAMYGKPVLAATVEVAPVAEPAPAPQTQPASTEIVEVAQAEPAEEVVEEVVEEEPVPLSEDRINQAFNTDNSAFVEPESQRITISQQLTGGDMPWIAIGVSALGFSLAGVWLFKHVVLVRRFIINGEHFVAHHPILDLFVVSLVAAAVYLSQTSGVIQ